VQGIGHVLVGTGIAFHVIEHKHFPSDSLWGAAMGWYVGQWVVKHRASWLYGERHATPITIAPAVGAGFNGVAILIAI
jgi:hypothetical protein